MRIARGNHGGPRFEDVRWEVDLEWAAFVKGLVPADQIQTFYLSNPNSETVRSLYCYDERAKWNRCRIVYHHRPVMQHYSLKETVASVWTFLTMPHLSTFSLARLPVDERIRFVKELKKNLRTCSDWPKDSLPPWTWLEDDGTSTPFGPTAA